MPLEDAMRFVETYLGQRSLPHVYVGGIAVSRILESRATRDADIILQLPLEQAADLVNDIERQGADIYNKPHTIEKLSQGRPAKFPWSRNLSFDFRLAFYDIDFSAISRAKSVPLPRYNITIPVATAEDLIVYKLARFNKLDQHDIEGIISEARDLLDWPYIDGQTNILGEQAHIPEMLSRLEQAKRGG